MQEIWKDVVGYEGIYQVSNTGKVRNIRGYILSPADNGNGYLRFSLYKSKKVCSTQYLHRLIAEAFIPNPDKLSEINHKDENKKNNNIDNLEWVTHVENCNYGTRIQRYSEKALKPVKQIDSNGKTLAVYPGVIKATRALGLNSKSAITNCIAGRSKYCRGFKWEYA